MNKPKFRAWNGRSMTHVGAGYNGEAISYGSKPAEWVDTKDWPLMQYTGLNDKNGQGLLEVYEGDIIGTSSIIGNIYETNPRETDLVIPKLGTKAWHDAYKEAVERGFDYAE